MLCNWKYIQFVGVKSELLTETKIHEKFYTILFTLWHHNRRKKCAEFGGAAPATLKQRVFVSGLMQPCLNFLAAKPLRWKHVSTQNHRPGTINHMLGEMAGPVHPISSVVLALFLLFLSNPVHVHHKTCGNQIGNQKNHENVILWVVMTMTMIYRDHHDP